MPANQRRAHLFRRHVFMHIPQIAQFEKRTIICLLNVGGKKVIACR